MTTVLVVAGVVVGLWILHRVACALEDRGLIYYRRGQGRAGIGSALGAAEEAFRPQVEHVRKVEIVQVGRASEGGCDPEPTTPPWTHHHR